MHYGYYSSNGSFGIWGFLLSGLWHLVLLTLVICFIVWLFRGHRGRRWHNMPGMWQSHSALTILNERYAKGEISKEEYEERKKTLMAQ
jgi:putative membrane protein